jgi:hypothetical protein
MTASLKTNEPNFKSMAPGDDALHAGHGHGRQFFHSGAAQAGEAALIVGGCRLRVAFAKLAWAAGAFHQSLATEQCEGAVDSGAVHAGIVLLGHGEEGGSVERRAAFLNEADEEAALGGHAHAERDELAKERGAVKWGEGRVRGGRRGYFRWDSRLQTSCNWRRGQLVGDAACHFFQVSQGRFPRVSSCK